MRKIEKNNICGNIIPQKKGEIYMGQIMNKINPTNETYKGRQERDIVAEIAPRIISYYEYSYRQDRNIYDNNGNLNSKYYDYKGLTFSKYFSSLRDVCDKPNPILCYPTLIIDRIYNPTTIRVEDEDAIINIFYDAVTGNIISMNYTFDIKDERPNRRINISETVKLIDCFEKRTLGSNEITIEEILSQLQTVDPKMKKNDYSMLYIIVSYRKRMLELIDSLYKAVHEYVSKKLPAIYTDRLKYDFLQVFGYSPEKVEGNSGKTDGGRVKKQLNNLYL
jgi:hypothetical protein